MWIVGVGDDKDLVATAEICQDLKPRDWRHWLHLNIFSLLETDYASRILAQRRFESPARTDGLSL